jgi:hypothetical protein
MSRFSPVLFFCVLAVTAGCVPATPHLRDDARSALISIRDKGAESLFPAEYASIQQTVETGDNLVREEDISTADGYFRLALIKSTILEKELAGLQARLADEERRKAHAARLEAERQESLRAAERRAGQERKALEHITITETARSKDNALPSYHTVKRGETLPHIASQPDVYNDSRLWPLLYRANRDQISDPKHIWPGQVLRIPRNPSRDDLAEARRFSQSKPLH